jgi:hypothetical protein
MGEAVVRGLPHSFGEYPLQRSERKPSGILLERILGKIKDVQPEGYYPGKPQIILAMVGDKPSDLKEAQALQHKYSSVTVVGFMVEAFGGSDHPLDTVFGIRRRATAFRESLEDTTPGIFVH